MARSARSLHLRQQRLRHAASLRRLARRRQKAFVSSSFAVFIVSLIGVWAVAGWFGDREPVGPLYATAGSAGPDLGPRDVLPRDAAVRRAVNTPGKPEPRPSTDTNRAKKEPAPKANESVTTQPAPRRATRQFNRKPVELVEQRRMLVTAYCPNACCCGKHADGKTASGHSVQTNGGNLVAADTRILPIGSLVQVPGYDEGRIVPVLDRGGKIKGNRLDLLMPTHAKAKKWGARWITVNIYDYQ